MLAEELTRSRIGDRIRWLVGPAAMMTSLDMRGFSVSLLPVTRADVAALAAPVAPWAWPGCLPWARWRAAAARRADADPADPLGPYDATRALSRRCCRVLIGAEAELNALDAKSGDGDTGHHAGQRGAGADGALDRLPLADQTQLYRAIGLELSQTMGGSSGVLLAIFFAAAGDASAGGQGPDRRAEGGARPRCSRSAARSPGDRTMIDALFPALEALPEGLGAPRGRRGAGRMRRRGSRGRGPGGQAISPRRTLPGTTTPARRQWRICSRRWPGRWRRSGAPSGGGRSGPTSTRSGRGRGRRFRRSGPSGRLRSGARGRWCVRGTGAR